MNAVINLKEYALTLNHKTGNLEGELDRITPEEKAELDRLAEAGLMTSTRHPSEEVLAAQIKRLQARGFGCESGWPQKGAGFDYRADFPFLVGFSSRFL